MARLVFFRRCRLEAGATYEKPAAVGSGFVNVFKSWRRSSSADGRDTFFAHVLDWEDRGDRRAGEPGGGDAIRFQLSTGVS